VEGEGVDVAPVRVGSVWDGSAEGSPIEPAVTVSERGTSSGGVSVYRDKD